MQGVTIRVRYRLARSNILSPLFTYASNYDAKYLDRQHVRVLIPHTVPVDVIVCVHNALPDVERCLESILSHTLPPYHLILVDDGSAEDTREYLESFCAGQPITLIRHDVAMGYTKAANRGMNAAKSDYILLLNSDTVVPSCWLDRLIKCANVDSRIGMVGPLSNTASWQSVPQVSSASGDWEDNPLPQGWSVNRYANEVARVSPRIYPRVGFLNGFCLLIKRTLIDDIGYFDEDTFARGYGEENDYCLRATDKGWHLAVADDCYVFHAQSKSYSHERRAELCRMADEALANKHGPMRIGQNLAMTQMHPALQYMRKRCESIETESCLRDETLRRFEGKRILFLLPERMASGGSNIILLETMHMRENGVDAWIANLEINRELFEKSHPDLSVPVLYLPSHKQLQELANEFDALVATAYTTVFWLPHFAGLIKHPVLGYYIQDFEPSFFPEGSAAYQQALASYTAITNMRLFTKTRWNCEELENKLGIIPEIVGPSADMDTNYPSPFGSNIVGKIRISAMVRPSTSRRGPEMTMRIMKRLVKHFGDRLDITIFGVHPMDPLYLSYPRDFAHRCLGELTANDVADVLRTTEIFLDCSTFQAMGLTAMEAMACGAAVVGPINGGLSEVITHGHNGLLVDTWDENAIWEAVCLLIKDANELARIRNNAFGVLSHLPLNSAYKILVCLFGADAPNAIDLQTYRSEMV